MSLPSDLAVIHQRRRKALTDSATAQSLRVWRSVDPQELDLGWTIAGPRMVDIVSAAQVQAAQQATPYLASVAAYYGTTETATLVSEAFSGITLDGRELGPAMYGAVTTTKTLTSRVGAGRAFEVGASFLATVIGSAIQDMGRAADGTLAVGRQYTGYVRVISAGACSRCAVLAGKASYKTAFKRHPRCHCTAMPVPKGMTSPAGFFDSPRRYFDSLSRAEQDRIFTQAGAEAIRNGADIGKVVNARRGAYGIGYSGHYNVPVVGNRLQPVAIGVRADGSPLQVYATTEGTTRRGANFAGAGQRSATLRLMPEQIAVMADGDPVRWRELLIRYGYLT